MREEVNDDKTTNMVMSRVQNVRRSHSINKNNRFAARAEEFK